jgi:RNA polymerase sigma-70 factor (ECF subfamily)
MHRRNRTIAAREGTIEDTAPAASPESLLDRAKTSDPGAIDELLHALRPLVYRWARVRTGDADDAEDVTQRVLLRVHERIGQFEGRSSLTTWLYRVTANAANELDRRRGAIHRLKERWGGLDTKTQEPDPIDAIDNQRTKERILEMMRELSPMQRVTLDLVDLQGYEPAEAAEMLEMNPTTVRVHLLRARRALRKRILVDRRPGDAS